MGPVHLQSVQQVGPALSTLTPEVQRQVTQRITVDNQAAGERVLAEVSQGTLPDDGAGDPRTEPDDDRADDALDHLLDARPSSPTSATAGAAA